MFFLTKAFKPPKGKHFLKTSPLLLKTLEIYMVQ